MTRMNVVALSLAADGGHDFDDFDDFDDFKDFEEEGGGSTTVAPALPRIKPRRHSGLLCRRAFFGKRQPCHAANTSL